ncbi:MAG TPA: hypothetical protein VKM55_12250 [Candidatus Lokiarchaeia archaeon]|nr:hypothetical protein [Candidatus Lokiarchaeia archaeon]
MMSENFDRSVFNVQDPSCTKCHSPSLDFELIEDYAGSGMDWVQWYCKHEGCDYYINVEIL